MLRIGALSDTHLDEKATAAGKIILDADGRNIRAADRERCLAAAIDGMIERGVDLILHAGDLFDHPRPTPAEYVIAEREMDRAAAQAHTVMVACNHGLAASPTEQHAIAPLAGRRASLKVYLRPEMHNIFIDAFDLAIQVAVLPFPSKALLLAKDEYAGRPPEEVNAIIAAKLSAIVRGFRATLDPALPSVLLTHLMVKEAVFGNDQQADFGMLAMSAEDFDGFDLVVAGDVHRHQLIGERFLIPGSTDRCSFGEEHEPKGWCYVELDGPGAVPRVELVETPARQYLTLTPEALIPEMIQSIEVASSYPESVPIYRLKGKVTQEEYDALQPTLAKLRGFPTFSEALEVTRTTRARSEAMKQDLSAEAALKLWHEANSRPEDLAELLEEHAALVGSGK